jgi:hypothetical protein
MAGSIFVILEYIKSDKTQLFLTHTGQDKKEYNEGVKL